MISKIHSTLLQIDDVNQTETFYKALGFDTAVDKETLRINFGDYKLAFLAAKKDPQAKPGVVKGVGMYIYFEITNMDSFITSVESNGITLDSQPITQPWGKIELEIIDPDGYKLVFFENV